MIKSIKFIKYKKFSNIEIPFSKYVNVISGENGTCKSSLLYLVSNSFQAIKSESDFVKDKKAIHLIKKVNMATNPKIETLQRGDHKYNNPAIGVPGILYSINYYGYNEISFRRHNSLDNNKYRYAMKPKYKRGSGEKLPSCPVVYLGLSRLVPYGEYNDDSAVAILSKSLPESFQNGVAEKFKSFTSYSVNNQLLQSLGALKKRAEFTSDSEGIDSNTISAGEDNLFIILEALESLKYYYNSIISNNEIESILLIDEFDASLHPDYQIKLLQLMRDYSKLYKIQIFLTTHSLTTIENALEMRDNVIYLVDNISHVSLFEDPTIFSIKAHLYNTTTHDIYRDCCIPVFTEDNEARFLINCFFDHFEKTKPEFSKIRRFFQMPEINIGANILDGLFKDGRLIRSNVGAFCILDGDYKESIDDCIIALPGNCNGIDELSPEKLLFEYAKVLAERDDHFWEEREIIKQGFSKTFYQTSIANEIEQYSTRKAQGEDVEKERAFNKTLFNKNLQFFKMIFIRWLNDDNNSSTINSFYGKLRRMFKKCAELRGIDSNEWK